MSAAENVARAPSAQWDRVRRFFESMTREEFVRRAAAARRMIKENGVTYNLYDDAAGTGRPWHLDIVPFVIGSEEWSLIEAAVAQRARLADAILRDVYGSQRLVGEGHIPPHLVYGHPQYLRALCGVEPPGGVHVHLYAADLARRTDGTWTILASRVDAPTGIGYALENRIVVGQTLPELFGEMPVQRLASFFADFRDSVFGLGNHIRGRAVLLTPGPYNEAYFEHAFLAHYLGLELVEGDDLAVRDGNVFLRTIGGLARVAFIFRRLDSDFCDPVELRADSALGIPGLVDAVRTRGVIVANALGAGVVESPALDAYLPAIARFFGEELVFPDVPTIWCGTQWGREAALARLSRSVVRDAFDARPLFSRGSSARLGKDLTGPEIAALADHLERRGATTVVQEIVPLGDAPTFERRRFTTRPLSLRLFAAWTPNGYVVMPGGLARVATDDSVRALTMQSGAASKDIWVLAPGRVDTFSLLRPSSEPVALRRSGDVAPSRAMDNLFWLGRYVERTENLVRILRAVGTNDERITRRLRTIASGDQAQSLTSMLAHVARTAWSVRDRLSPDTWRAVLALTAPERTGGARGRPPSGVPQTYLEALIRRTAAISGISAENMTRGSNWLFFDLGRRIERALLTCNLAKRIFSATDPRESEHVQIALEIADSAMTYRYRYLNVFQVAPALDLLLLDPTNPRATAFQIAASAHHVAALPAETDVQRREIPKAIAGYALEAVAQTDARALAEVDARGRRPALRFFLEDLTTAMVRLSDALGVAYFHHATSDASLAVAPESR